MNLVRSASFDVFCTFCSTLKIQPISTCGTFHADASVVDVVTDVQDEVVELSSECSTAIDLTMNDDDDDLDVTTEDEGGNPDVKTEDRKSVV